MKFYYIKNSFDFSSSIVVAIIEAVKITDFIDKCKMQWDLKILVGFF